MPSHFEPGTEETPELPLQLSAARAVSRRRFLYRMFGVSVATPALAALYTWQVEPHWLEVVHRDLPVVGLPAGLEGARLLHLSDIHVGPDVSARYLEESFARATSFAPEFVVVTGDWVTYRDASQFAQLERALEHLPRGKLGTIGVLGNHDYGFRWSMLDVAERIAAIARQNGVDILRNEARRVAGLQFIGLDDFWSPRFAPRAVLAQHGGDDATVVLCHNPDAVDEPVWAGFRGWILAGHTHGGQCKAPFLRPPLLPVRNKRYVRGEIAIADGRTLYINRGLGHLLQVRFNVRPEMTLFRLRARGNR